MYIDSNLQCISCDMYLIKLTFKMEDISNKFILKSSTAIKHKDALPQNALLKKNLHIHDMNTYFFSVENYISV